MHALLQESSVAIVVMGAALSQLGLHLSLRGGGLNASNGFSPTISVVQRKQWSRQRLSRKPVKYFGRRQMHGLGAVSKHPKQSTQGSFRYSHSSPLLKLQTSQ
eukprot:Trichotokara_eunicae@DN5941_c0_g1_i1.p2